MHRELTNIENLTVSLTALYIAAGEQTDNDVAEEKENRE